MSIQKVIIEQTFMQKIAPSKEQNIMQIIFIVAREINYELNEINSLLKLFATSFTNFSLGACYTTRSIL